MKRTKSHLVYFVVAMALFAVASTMDYNDQLAQQQYQCEMIKTGHWPQFKDMECNDENN